MKDKELVSIIIPTYNRAELVVETLDSINHQSYQNWECIIVDDNSTDQTEEVIKKYIQNNKKFRFYKRPLNLVKGANACRNFGYSKSKGNYINWFDSDDIMHEDKLKIQVNHLKKTELPFTVCQTLVFEDNLQNVLGLRCDSIYSKNFFGDFITNKIKWLTQAPLMRRSFLETHNLTFDRSLSQSQERDFFIKVLDLVDDYHYDDRPLVYFRKHKDSISHSKECVEKLESNFKVNFMALDTFGHKLDTAEKYILKKGIQQVIKKSIKNKYFNLLDQILNKMRPHFSIREKIKISLAIRIYNITGRGDTLFK